MRSTSALAIPCLCTCLLAATACDEASTPEFESTFRVQAIGDLTSGPRRLNTNFLGLDEAIPFNSLPGRPGTVPGVDIQEIRATECVDVIGETLTGEFSTAGTGAPLVVPLSKKGRLRTLTVAEVGNPASTCEISGDLWENTHWELQLEHDGETLLTDLRLTDVATDEFGREVYRWDVNLPRLDPTYEGEIQYFPTCDEDLDDAPEGLGFHAYLIPNFAVDEASGDHLYAHRQIFIACISGVLGKTNLFGYHHTKDMFETATRMVGADYCGDGNRMTEEGTPVLLTDSLGVWPGPVATEPREAGWSIAAGRAICLDTPRRPELVPTSLSCDGEILPPCDTVLLSKSDLVTHSE